jgi:hypothetical protein
MYCLNILPLVYNRFSKRACTKHSIFSTIFPLPNTDNTYRYTWSILLEPEKNLPHCSVAGLISYTLLINCFSPS